jgi:hypothetical protein
MSNPNFANGSVNPDGSNEPEIKDANVSSEPTLTDEELQLQKEEEKVQNMKKALEHSTRKYEEIKSQVKQIRDETKVLNNELKELEQSQNISTNETSNLEQLVEARLEILKQEPRQKALSVFFNQYPEIVQDETLQTKLMQRYHQIKESNEMDPELIIRDLESSYFSLRGVEILKRQVNNDFSTEQFSVGARYTGTSQVGVSSTTNINLDRKVYKAVQDLSHLGITPEKARELKKKGYLK